ncbi:baseplate protein J [Nostoc sp. KVJ20]|uniref:baseplate protein J n=1 Tax=Nostoc sp. KVJ20 TaxID=457944 RepID=UPI00083DCAF9|nr:baseplate protein J [Nostoc sp. KVJ20]ODG98630.1 baseplate protein J [Nostoc sp. KVJ20]
MTLPLPNLDDRTYANLVEEAISQIPVEYPEWTDHNPTDTGIILIELLAWLTEMTLYRVNQIPDDNYASFMSLLKGEQWNLPINLSAQERQKTLQSEIKNTLLELRKTYRAITPDDFEKLVLIDWNQSPDYDGLKIARIKCLAQRNLSHLDANTVTKGHISLVVVPENNQGENQYKNLFNFLDNRRLLTTRLHIVEPEYVSIAVEVELVLEDGAQAEAVKKQAKKEVEMFFDPLRSQKYWQGKGWPFGRSVYISELYKLLDDLEGVDYVENLQIKDKNNTSKTEINLADNQLVKLNIENTKFTILVEVDNERKKL